jgi:hypothetical protein
VALVAIPAAAGGVAVAAATRGSPRAPNEPPPPNVAKPVVGTERMGASEVTAAGPLTVEVYRNARGERCYAWGVRDGNRIGARNRGTRKFVPLPISTDGGGTCATKLDSHQPLAFSVDSAPGQPVVIAGLRDSTVESISASSSAGAIQLTLDPDGSFIGTLPDGVTVGTLTARMSDGTTWTSPPSIVPHPRAQVPIPKLGQKAPTPDQ